MFKPYKANNFIFIIIVGTLIISQGVIIGLEVIKQLFNINYSTSFVSIVITLLTILLPVLIYCGVQKISFKSVFPTQKISKMNIFLVICIYFLSVPICAFIANASDLLFENIVEDYLLEVLKEPFLISVIYTCVFPAFFEELLMRGVVLKSYENVPIKIAAVCNGILFGVLHLNFSQFFYAFFLGFIFSYIVYYTKNIVITMALHFLYNFTSVSAMYTIYEEGARSGKTIQELFVKPPYLEQVQATAILGVISVFSGVFLIIIMKYFIAINKRKFAIQDIINCLKDDTPMEQTDTRHNSVLTFGFFASVAVFFVCQLSYLNSF